MAISIRVRLALVYAAVLSVIVLIFGVLLYVAVQQYLVRQTDESVARLARHVAAALPAGDQLSAESMSMVDIDPFTSPGMHVQILDGTGQPILHSAGLSIRTLPASDADVRLALLGVATFYTADAGGQRIRVYNLPLEHGGKTVGVVQVGKSYLDYDLTLAQLSQATALGGGLAIVLAGLISWAVAGRALRPVADITATARAIALSQGFSRRLVEWRNGERGDEVDRLALAFNEMLASLESAYKSQRRFVADASHELRAPLTTVVGNLEFLRKADGLAPQEREEALDDALAEARRMGRLVGDLLSLARTDASQRLNMEPVALGQVVRDLWEETLLRADGRQLVLTSAAEVTVWGDRDQLKQVALVLMDNALKYTPAGGRVELSVGWADGRAVLRVADTGIGIEPEDLPHVFERFYRADKARSRDDGGSGLGLSIARSIVERHHGTIEVQSTSGNGSAFTVHLPALAAAVPESTVATR